MLKIMPLPALALLVAPISLAAQQPGDTVTVHVSASHWTLGGGPPGINNTEGSTETLETVIDGKKLELIASLSGPDVLLPGDYRAQLLSERHESPVELRQSYRIILPNNRSRNFDVVGVEE
jgi:hypothetical protein